MRTAPSSNPAAGTYRGGEKRRAERHKTDALGCELGDVVDVSELGMRIRCKSKPPIKVGQIFPMKLQSDSARLQVTAQVVRMVRVGFRGCELGVQFVNLKPSVVAAILSLVMFGCIDFQAAAEARKRREVRNAGSASASERAPAVRATADLPNYYAVLGVNSSDSTEEIHRAYRKLAMKYHPDVCRTEDGARKFIEISQAYDVLGDSDSRQLYDARMAG